MSGNGASFEAFATHRLWQGLETTLDDLRVHYRKHPDVYKKLLEEIEPGRAHGLRVASGTMSDEPMNPLNKRPTLLS
jgi:hypothetical protein